MMKLTTLGCTKCPSVAIKVKLCSSIEKRKANRLCAPIRRNLYRAETLEVAGSDQRECFDDDFISGSRLFTNHLAEADGVREAQCCLSSSALAEFCSVAT